MNFRNYQNLSKTIKSILPKIADVDLIVGIPRSGMVPAYMTAAFLNRYVCSLDEFIEGFNFSKGSRKIQPREIKKVLIVDDSVGDGTEMARVREKLKGFDKKYELVFMAVYVTETGKDKVDVYGEICPQPRIFQWNYLYHPYAASVACYDIDGVLCIDPTEDENDDGEKYRKFLLNAEPLYLTNYKIRALVTSRLEKYRPETEAWLKKHNVQYEELYMLDLPNKEARIKAGAHAPFKAEIYKKLKDTKIFIESSSRQAGEIFRLSGKNVICTENDAFFSNDFELPENVLCNRKKYCSKFEKMALKLFCLITPVRSWRKCLRSLYK